MRFEIWLLGECIHTEPIYDLDVFDTLFRSDVVGRMKAKEELIQKLYEDMKIQLRRNGKFFGGQVYLVVESKANTGEYNIRNAEIIGDTK